MFMCLGDLQKEDKRKKDSGWINNVHERIDITVFLKCLCALQESVYLLLNNFFFCPKEFLKSTQPSCDFQSQKWRQGLDYRKKWQINRQIWVFFSTFNVI